VLVVTKSGTISVRPDQVLNLDRVETDMIVNPQTSPPSGFLNANGTRFQFQLLPSNYCIVHSYVEFDITNTTAAAFQLTPLPFLVDRIRMRNRAGNILQEAMGDQIYQELCFNYSQNQLINLQNLTNTSATTFGSYTAIAAVAYSIPLSCMFLDQIKFFTGSLGLAGLIVEVLSNGPACVITPAATPAGINLVASRLRITAETISQCNAEALRNIDLGTICTRYLIPHINLLVFQQLQGLFTTINCRHLMALFLVGNFEIKFVRCQTLYLHHNY